MEHTASRLEDEGFGAAGIFTRPASSSDAPLVYDVYTKTPDYFRIISIPMPSLEEVRRELEAAESDPRRCTELILSSGDAQALTGAASDANVIGYLDYKLHYPEHGDVMVNLLLIAGPLQSKGYGRACITDLETRLDGHVKRVLASIYGQNPRAEQFWRSLGYRFAIDAKPVLDWYAKEL